MKILILGNLHSLAGLQDALSGKGLPLIPGEAQRGRQHLPPAASPFDCVLLDGRPHRLQAQSQDRTASAQALIHSLQLQARLKTGQAAVPRGPAAAEHDAVVFEYHAPCTSARPHQALPE